MLASTIEAEVAAFVAKHNHLNSVDSKVVGADFDCYVEKTLRVSSTCLIRVDHNRYSVPAEWANRVVSLRVTASQVRVVAENQLIAEHSRRLGRDQLICNPWHYLPILEKKPGALRHTLWGKSGAPFLSWDLPVSIKVVRDRILKQDKGDREFVELLLIPTRGTSG